jgi:hypothetical protein
MYSGLAMYILRPATSRGRPAFGCALNLRVVTGAIRSIASRIACGPTEQLSPTTSAPIASSDRATSSGDAPYGVRPSVPIVICAMTGTCGSTSRAARTACASSWRSANVSRMKQSAPPSRSAIICSAKCARASPSLVGPYGSRRTPSGPIAPATISRSPATSRATRAAARLSSVTCASNPYCASFTRFAPKVFVSSASAPAFAYAAWTSRTSSGARRFSSS